MFLLKSLKHICNALRRLPSESEHSKVARETLIPRRQWSPLSLGLPRTISSVSMWTWTWISTSASEKTVETQPLSSRGKHRNQETPLGSWYRFRRRILNASSTLNFQPLSKCSHHQWQISKLSRLTASILQTLRHPSIHRISKVWTCQLCRLGPQRGKRNQTKSMVLSYQKLIKRTAAPLHRVMLSEEPTRNRKESPVTEALNSWTGLWSTTVWSHSRSTNVRRLSSLQSTSLSSAKKTVNRCLCLLRRVATTRDTAIATLLVLTLLSTHRMRAVLISNWKSINKHWHNSPNCKACRWAKYEGRKHLKHE